MHFIAFIIVFLYIANRGQIHGFIESFIKNKKPKKDITDKRLLDKINEKTGLHIGKIYLIESTRFYAVVISVLSKPYILVSNLGLELFDENELEWLFLHEAGHHVRKYMLQAILAHISLIFVGIVVLYFFPNIPFSIVIATILGVIYIQLARFGEYEANDYALSKISNPEYIISAAEKMKKRYEKLGIARKSIIRKMFDVWIYEVYVKMQKDAKEKLKNKP